MGAPIAGADGFNYSDALAGKEGEWTWAKMDAWLENPADWAPGTSMSYAGIKDPQDRADMIAYLRSLAAEPLPLPEPETAPAEGAGTDEASGSEPATGDDAAAAEAADPAAGEPADAPAEEAAGTTEAAGEESEAAAAAGAADGGTAEETTVAATTPADATPSAESAAPSAAPVAADPMVQRVAAASVADGEGGFRACAACHTAAEGRPHRVGPNLWDVFGREIAALDDFGYSDALAGKEGRWTVATLDDWLADPAGWAKGTTMVYAGLKDPEERAAVIAYLHSLADAPAPLGAVKDEASAADEG
jgi:cytochrome c